MLPTGARRDWSARLSASPTIIGLCATEMNEEDRNRSDHSESLASRSYISPVCLGAAAFIAVDSQQSVPSCRRGHPFGNHQHRQPTAGNNTFSTADQLPPEKIASTRNRTATCAFREMSDVGAVQSAERALRAYTWLLTTIEQVVFVGLSTTRQR